MRAAAACVGRFDSKAPGLTVGPQSQGAHLAINADQARRLAVRAQHLGQAIDAIALGDAV